MSTNTWACHVSVSVQGSEWGNDALVSVPETFLPLPQIVTELNIKQSNLRYWSYRGTYQFHYRSQWPQWIICICDLFTDYNREKRPVFCHLATSFYTLLRNVRGCRITIRSLVAKLPDSTIKLWIWEEFLHHDNVVEVNWQAPMPLHPHTNHGQYKVGGLAGRHENMPEN